MAEICRDKNSINENESPFNYRESLALMTKHHRNELVPVISKTTVPYPCHKKCHFPNKIDFKSNGKSFFPTNYFFFAFFDFNWSHKKRVVISHIDKISLGRYHYTDRGDSVVWTKVAYYFVQEKKTQNFWTALGEFRSEFRQAYGVYSLMMRSLRFPSCIFQFVSVLSRYPIRNVWVF